MATTVGVASHPGIAQSVIAVAFVKRLASGESKLGNRNRTSSSSTSGVV